LFVHTVQHEIAFAENPVSLVTPHGDLGGGHGLQCLARARQLVGNPAIVLRIGIASDAGSELLHAPVDENVVDDSSDEYSRGPHQYIRSEGGLFNPGRCRTGLAPRGAGLFRRQRESGL